MRNLTIKTQSGSLITFGGEVEFKFDRDGIKEPEVLNLSTELIHRILSENIERYADRKITYEKKTVNN